MPLQEYKAAFSQQKAFKKSDKCYSDSPNTQQKRCLIKTIKMETYMPGWLLFLFSPFTRRGKASSYFFTHVTCLRCCSCFVNSPKQQHFLQNPALLTSALPQPCWQWEWMELRHNFLFWNKLKKSEHWLLTLKTLSHVSTNTFVWCGGKLLADADRYCENILFQEPAETVGHAKKSKCPCASQTLQTVTSAWRAHASSQKGTSVLSCWGFSTFLLLIQVRGFSVNLESCF